MESKIREIINCAIEKNSVFSHKKIEGVHLVRAREGEFVWQIFLSPKNIQPECIFVKAVKPRKKNLSEILLYKKNPIYLNSFFPTVYGVIKKYGFYWFLLERLKQLPFSTISLENFKRPIEFMASLHAKFYSDNSIMKNEQINWVPHFKKQWQKRMNKLKLIVQLRKYTQCFNAAEILKEDRTLLREAMQNSGKVLSPLLKTPHSLIHGCFEYHHIYTSFDESKPVRLRLIDWENLSFAPVTLDLVYLIEKSVDHGINNAINPVRKLTRTGGIKPCVREKRNNPVACHGAFSNGVNLPEFRDECLSYYRAVMKDCGVTIEETEFKKLYNFTFAFKIIGQFIFEELKKIKKGEPSNYNFYRDQLSILGKSLELIG